MSIMSSVFGESLRVASKIHACPGGVGFLASFLKHLDSGAFGYGNSASSLGLSQSICTAFIVRLISCTIDATS